MINNRLIKKIKNYIPEPFNGILLGFWKSYRQWTYRNQGSITTTVAGMTLSIPRHHSLPGLMANQPLRDQCVGLTARMVSQKYPDQTMIDIGANVGDTAAIMAENCSNPLVLVEASDIFFDYLARNTQNLKNRISLKKVIVSDGSSLAGELLHWGGTAEWKESPTASPVATEKLGNLTHEKVCFVKTDTDGHDFKILMAGLDWLEKERPVILFESQIRNAGDLATCGDLIQQIFSAGYQYFIVWEDAGIFVLSTKDPEVVMDMNRYILNQGESGRSQMISNFDIACFHEKDADIYESVANSYR